MPATEPNEVLLDHYPVHPGTLLKLEVLPARKVTGVALAEATRTPRPAITKMLNAKASVTPLMAARIEAAIGYPAELLCRMQTAFDLASVRRESADSLEAIQRIAA